MTKRVYRICHAYDATLEKPRFVLAAEDPTRAAVYCQFIAEEALGAQVSVLNTGIANALVEFYGGEHAEPTQTAGKIDMFYERERLCGGGYEDLMADLSLRRAGLLEVLRPHVEGL